MLLPRSNGGAALGGVIVTLVVVLLQGLSNFLASGQPWPTTPDGWLRVVLPALVVGLLSALTPYAQFSASPAATDVVWRTTSTGDFSASPQRVPDSLVGLTAQTGGILTGGAIRTTGTAPPAPPPVPPPA